MKKILIAFIGTALLTSCGSNNLTDLNKPESFTQLEELAEKNFGEDKEIYAFKITTKDHLTSEVRNLSIDYLDNGLRYSRDYNITNEEGKELEEPKKASDNFQSEFFLKNKQGKMKVKDIDFQLINTKYDEALKLISDEYDEFTLHSWEYEVDNDGVITANFMIEAILKGEGTSLEGRNIVTNYYEFPFKMNEKQELEFEED